MFRFTIRELVLLTLVVAMGVGWWLDHAAKAVSAEAENDATFLAQVAIHGCHCQFVDRLETLRVKYGVKPAYDFANWRGLTEERRRRADGDRGSR
jgi:hypothetical protein